jgi:hypothetical protein
LRVGCRCPWSGTWRSATGCMRVARRVAVAAGSSSGSAQAAGAARTAADIGCSSAPWRASRQAALPRRECAGGSCLSAWHQRERKVRIAVEGAVLRAMRGEGAVGQGASGIMSRCWSREAKARLQMSDACAQTNAEIAWQRRDKEHRDGALTTVQPPPHPLHLAHASPSTSTTSVRDRICDTCRLTNGPRLNARFCWPTRPFFDSIFAPCSRTQPTACEIVLSTAFYVCDYRPHAWHQPSQTDTQTWRPRESMRRWSPRTSSP